jgi:cytochrome P450
MMECLSEDHRTDFRCADRARPNNLADPDLYTKRDAHLVWQTLRAECPVFWQNQPGGSGFWAVTRHVGVRRVLSEHKTFTSQSGTAIAMLDGPDPAAGLLMQATDPPRHRQFREHLANTAWIASANRDERTFARAYALDFGRVPSRHMTFGAGPHICLGRNLGRLMLWHSFAHLIASVDSLELADAPVHLASNEIAGVVGLPVRAKMR